MLADSLPDTFGIALKDTWLATQGRSAGSFNPVERLCYIGTRGMGALEFHSTIFKGPRKSQRLEIDSRTKLANEVLNNRANLTDVLKDNDDHETLQEILRVGTSARHARAKAILAWNEETGESRSGQVKAWEGFTHWLMKLDGISNNRDKELADPQGCAAGIDMTECRVHHEGGRLHFMTQCFDRTVSGQKFHMQSLAAIRHCDFNAAGAIPTNRRSRRSGCSAYPLAHFRHRATVSSSCLQHTRPKPRPPRQEHRLPHESKRRVAAVTGV
nr:HipA domain-containing protein [Rhizobium rhizophilum]